MNQLPKGYTMLSSLKYPQPGVVSSNLWYHFVVSTNYSPVQAEAAAGALLENCFEKSCMLTARAARHPRLNSTCCMFQFEIWLIRVAFKALKSP